LDRTESAEQRDKRQSRQYRVYRWNIETRVQFNVYDNYRIEMSFKNRLEFNLNLILICRTTMTIVRNIINASFVICITYPVVQPNSSFVVCFNTLDDVLSGFLIIV